MNDFILGHQIGENIADGVLDFFSEHRHRGRAGGVMKDGKMGVWDDIKDSWDLGLSAQDASDPRIAAYLLKLKEAIDGYKSAYHFCDADQAPWGVTELINIQSYDPGGGFKVFHYEKSGKTELDVKRHLVFMTFLNTIDPSEGGGTEFLYQNRIIPAEAGMTYIWPAEWTHTHRGQISPTREKVIATGWLSYA